MERIRTIQKSEKLKYDHLIGAASIAYGKLISVDVGRRGVSRKR